MDIDKEVSLADGRGGGGGWQLVGARDTGLLARVAEMAQRHPGHAPGDDGDGGAS